MAREFKDNAIVANRIMDLCDQYNRNKIDEATLTGCIRGEFSKIDLVEFVACQYLNGGKFVDINKDIPTAPVVNDEDRKIIAKKLNKGFDRGIMELYQGDGKYKTVVWELIIKE